MKVRCPKCQTSFQIPDPAAATDVPCDSCGAVLRVKPRGQSPRACPACGKPVTSDAALCVNCGLNLETGTAVHTSVGAAGEEPEEEEEEAPPSLPLRILMLIGEWMPGLLRPHIVILSFVVGLIGLGVVAFGLALFAFGALITCFAAGAIGVLIYAQAIAWLLDGELSWLVEALMNVEGYRWALFFALLAAPLVIGFVLFGLAGAAG